MSVSDLGLGQNSTSIVLGALVLPLPATSTILRSRFQFSPLAFSAAAFSCVMWFYPDYSAGFVGQAPTGFSCSVFVVEEHGCNGECCAGITTVKLAGMHSAWMFPLVPWSYLRAVASRELMFYGIE